MKQTARPHLKVDITQDVVRKDGYSVTMRLDDSLSSWWAVVRWNFTGAHWRPLLLSNVPHLFTRVIWRKIWRRSA